MSSEVIKRTSELAAPGTLPTLQIRPPSGWLSLDLKEIWGYRELLYFLVWRDLKVRYKQTVLGAMWAIAQPLFTTLIFTLFFGKMIGVGSDGVPYPIFAYAGILPWTYFVGAISGTSNSLVGSAHLIDKVYFPRLILPLAALGNGLVDLAVAFLFLVGMLFYYQVALTWSILMLPVLVLLTSCLSLGIGLLASALNVHYRDVGRLLPFVLQLGMYATPIIYPLSRVPEQWRWLIKLNPMTGVIANYRAALFGQQFDWASLAVTAGVASIILTSALFVFRRVEAKFADII